LTGERFLSFPTGRLLSRAYYHEGARGTIVGAYGANSTIIGEFWAGKQRKNTFVNDRRLAIRESKGKADEK